MLKMKTSKNTSALWDKMRHTPYSEEYFVHHLEKERRSIHWKRIKRGIIDKFGSFKNIKTIELGAGKGTYSLLFALKGAEVTVLDYSIKGLEMSKAFFKVHKAKATFVEMDALSLNKSLFSKFDVAMSFGTAEHFVGKKRIKFIQTHFDVLKEGGIALICVPNKWNLPYRLWMFLSKSFERWNFGEEYPFSIKELKEIGKKIGVTFDFIGVYLLGNKFHFLKRIRRLLKIPDRKDYRKMSRQIGTPLDKYLGPTITAIGNKIQKEVLE